MLPSGANVTRKVTASAWIASIGRNAPLSPLENQKGSGVTATVRVSSRPKTPTRNPLSFLGSSEFISVVFSRGVWNSSRTSKSRPSRRSQRAPPMSILASVRSAWPTEFVQPNVGPRNWKPEASHAALATRCAVAMSGRVVTRYKREMSWPLRGRVIVAEEPRAGRVSNSRRVNWVVKRPALINAFVNICMRGWPLTGRSRLSWTPLFKFRRRAATIFCRWRSFT